MARPKRKAKRRSRLMRWVIRMLEKWIGQYYEGPEVPPRITEELRLWTALNPDAEVRMVAGYCEALLESAYRDGFVRGYEWQERGWEGPSIDPEVLAEQESQNWSLADFNPRVRRILADGYDGNDPLANVASPDKRAFLEFAARSEGQTVIQSPAEYEDPIED